MMFPGLYIKKRYRKHLTDDAVIQIPVGWIDPIYKFMTYCENADIEHRVNRIEMTDAGTLAIEVGVAEEYIDMSIIAAMFLAKERCHSKCIHDGSKGYFINTEKGGRVVCTHCMLE
jgi:hypothetical protein